MKLTRTLTRIDYVVIDFVRWMFVSKVNKIPIAQFAVRVLERSQGRGSEILNKPKTFEQLSEEGREPYRRIKNWLQQEDPIADLRGKIKGT